MIYETADNVMKWIGGGNSGAGEFRGAAEVQGAMQGAVGASRGAAQETMKNILSPGQSSTNGLDAKGGQAPKQSDAITQTSVEGQNGGAKHEPKENS
jgi:hypothetical protein